MASATCSGNATPLSLPKDHRLTRDRRVQAVFDDGRFYKGTYVHLLVRTVEGDELRATVIVSPKTAAGAVERNRIKRISRESLRLRLPRLQSGYDLVLLATRDAHSELNRQDIDDDLIPLLDEANLFTEGDPGDSLDDPTEEDRGSLETVVVALINGYQRWISPFLGRHCRFSPTCSEYTKEAMHRHGVTMGILYGIWRLLRCHPFSKGGHDPVP